MSRISTGTVSVDAGGTVVTLWQGEGGVFLSNITSPPSSPIVIEGVANFIKARISTTSFELSLPHAGAGGDDLPCAISALTATETSVGTLNARTATVIQQLSALDANGRGLFYNLIGVTGDNDPGPGKLAFNNADPELVTQIYLDILDANEGGRDVSGLLGLWVDQTIIIVRSLDTNAYAAYKLSDTVTAAGGYAKAIVAYLAHDGTLADEPVSVEWRLPGVVDATPFWQTRIGADADALAARAGLGLVKQTSVTDATVGSLLTVGAFGLGRTAGLSSPDLLTLRAPGTYYCSTPTNSPSAGNGWLEAKEVAGIHANQIFTDPLTGNKYVNRMLNSVWQGWKRDFDEIITNANGVAYRLSNGLQICTVVNKVSGSGISSVSWTFPAAFSTTPGYAHGTYQQGAGDDAAILEVQPRYQGITSTAVTFNTKTNSVLGMFLVAIGSFL